MILTNCCAAVIDSQGYELMPHGTALFPAACYLDNLFLDPNPWHWHEEMEVNMVIQGQAAISSGSDRYILNPGDVLFTNAEVLHSGESSTGTDCITNSIVFHPRLIGGSPDSIFWQKYLKPLLSDLSLEGIRLSPEVPWQKDAIQAFQTAWQYCKDEPSGYEFEVRAALSRLIFQIADHRSASQSVHSEKSIRDGERIKLMLHYIQQNFASDLTIREIAQSASISVSECLRCFRSTIDCTPIQYLKQYRIQKAAELLATTDARISDIGMRCGFQEMSYFAKTFKEFRGCTPSKFRHLC